MRLRLALFVLSALLCTLVWGEADTLRVYSVQEVQRQNVWLTGNNPVALSMNRFRSFSIAEAGYSYREGNFGQPTLPATTHAYRVYSESFQTMGKVSLYGKLGYANDDRRQQNWNGMTGDYWQAVNLCDSMPGNQRAEQYQLTGGFALPLHPRWQVGAVFNYQVQQTAKDTDPRNSNQWMAWELTPGVGYRHGLLRLGVSLRYAARKESLEISNMGLHNTYPVFAAYPLGFFKTLPLDERPHWHYSGHEAGIAWQLAVEKGGLCLFQQLSADLMQQEVKSNRTLNRSEGETDGWQIDYRGTWQRHRPYTRSEWAWQATLRQADNYDLLQHQLTGGTPWESYGRVLRSTRRIVEGDLHYRHNILRDTLSPRFTLLAGVHYRHQESTLYFYPATFAQPLHRFTMYATLTQRFALPRRSHLDLSVGGYYGKGKGTLLREKQLSAGEESPDIRLWQNEALRQQTFDYETNPRWAIRTVLSYVRPMPRTALCWFVRLSGEYGQALQNRSPRKNIEITTRLGLLF